MEHPASVLLQLFAVLLAAKLGDEVFKRLGQPVVIGEILGGLVVGPAVLGLYDVNAETQLFAEIGVVVLLFRVGLDTRLHELVKVGATAIMVALLGVLFPFAAGMGLGLVTGESVTVAVFLAAALTATSVGITSRVLSDLGALRSLSGRVILGAAVIDDVLAMLILAFASGLAAEELSADRLLVLLVLAALFIGAVLLGGTRLLRRNRSILTAPRFAATPFLPGMLVMLGLAALASLIGLAAIIGAFLAGMVVGESAEREALASEVDPLAAFFTPFFFGAIGAQIDLAGLANPLALGLLALTTLVAIAAKFIGAGLGAIRLGRDRAILIGWGMVPRGEVGIVIAGLGLAAGAIGGTVYSVVVGMAILTTLVVPPLLPALLARAESGPAVGE